MTETQVGFLYKAASSLQRAEDSQNLTLLRSYYLMRCKNITKGYGLPEKHFSSKVRCSKCCIEWNKDTQTLVKPLKLTKKQRHRIRSQKATKTYRKILERRKQLLNSNEIEQVCSFCKQTTVTIAVKPEKIKETIKSSKEIPTNSKNLQLNKLNSTSKPNNPQPAKKSEHEKSKVNKNNIVNVYSITKDIFSLNNKKNNLLSAHKEEKKVIKNIKKKKDKFAGLCEKAVLATAKMKEQKDKQNKLNLFLKPSS